MAEKFAILRTAKLTTWGNVGGSGAHTYRVEGLAPNADSTRTRLNETLIGTYGDVVGDVRRRLAEVTENPRKNAVLAIEYLLTASPAWFNGKSEKKIKEWARAQIDFLKEKHGVNLVHAVLHRDETTPHIVAYVVPEVGGRLNCRALLGGRGKLAKLQTEYASAMSKFGLERGVEGSKAKRQTLKRFYSTTESIEEKALAEIEKLGEPVPPPRKKLFQTEAAYEKEREKWLQAERRRVRKLSQSAAKAIVGVKMLRQDNANLKAANGSLAGENEKLREDLSNAYKEMNLTKEDIAKLRKLDISLVAQELGHFGIVEPKENPIDLVKRIGKFDYQQAVAWLANAFSPEYAGWAVREDVKVKKPERPFTPAENMMKKIISQQLDGLGCSSYRISIINENDDYAPYLPGKRGDEEFFYSKEDIVNMIPFLRFQNNLGKHIYITPMDDHAYYVLIDDVRSSLEHLESKGFHPCIYQRTSWNKFQAVLKVTKDVERRSVIDFFNQINRKVGDESITGLRHPMRLAGFRNMKEKHNKDGKFPFVEVVKASNRFCTKSIEYIKKKYTPLEDTQEVKSKQIEEQSFAESYKPK